MNRKSPYTVEAALTLLNMSEAIKLARKSRGETVQMVADRLGVSASSIKRMESQDAEQIASLSAGLLVTALCSYGHTNALNNALKAGMDEQGDFLRKRAAMRGGR